MGISQNVIEVSEGHSGGSNGGPIIFNCATNSERSSLVAITVTAIQALNARQPVIASKFEFRSFIFHIRRRNEIVLKIDRFFHENLSHK